jgi:hypothetical protein
MLVEGGEQEGEQEGELEAAGPVEPGRSRANGIPWPIVSGALALLLVSFIAIVLAVALIPWTGNDDPEGAVNSFLAAFGENRKADMVEMYDPEDLADYSEMFGISVDEVKSTMAQSDSMEGTTITFEDLTYSAVVEEGAMVEVTSGTATITGADGETTTEDMAGAQFELVKRDGQWYLKMPTSSGQY